VNKLFTSDRNGQTCAAEPDCWRCSLAIEPARAQDCARAIVRPDWRQSHNVHKLCSTNEKSSSSNRGPRSSTEQEATHFRCHHVFGTAIGFSGDRKKCGSSLLQRRLRIGYGRAAHLIDFMENDGIVGAADGPKPREVLKRPDWITEMEQSLR